MGKREIEITMSDHRVPAIAQAQKKTARATALLYAVVLALIISTILNFFLLATVYDKVSDLRVIQEVYGYTYTQGAETPTTADLEG